MSFRMISAPASEPVTLAELKAHLNIAATDEDELLAMLIVVARATVERLTGRLLMTQSWRVTLDAVPASGLVTLPIGPVQTVTELTVHDGAGGSQLWPGSAYVLDLAGEPARLLFEGGVPIPGQRIAGIDIDVVAGYGATAASVPPELVQAVKLLAAHWYAARGDAADTSSIPDDVGTLIAGYRRLRLVA